MHQSIVKKKDQSPHIKSMVSSQKKMLNLYLEFYYSIKTMQILQTTSQGA